MTGKIIFAAACFVTALTFIEVGIYAFLTRKPMNFWTWQKVDPKKISDIKKYNRANGIMWICAGIPLLVFAALSFCMDIFPLGIALAVYLMLALLTLIFTYRMIEKKFMR